MKCEECFALWLAKVFPGNFYHAEQMVALVELRSHSFFCELHFSVSAAALFSVFVFFIQTFPLHRIPSRFIMATDHPTPAAKQQQPGPPAFKVLCPKHPHIHTSVRIHIHTCMHRNYLRHKHTLRSADVAYRHTPKGALCSFGYQEQAHF